MNIKEYQSKMSNIICDIKSLLSKGGYECQWLDNIDEPKNADERQLFHAFINLAENLENAVNTFEYYRLPIKAEQTLYYDTSDERYKCDYCTFTCGRIIEFYYYDEESENYKWATSRIEYSDRYYIVGYKGVSLDGLKVRFR